MKANRIITLTVAVLLAVPAAVAAPKSGGGHKKPSVPAPQTFTAPFPLAFASGGCSPETPTASCHIERAADASGALRSALSLERTIPDIAEWRAQASAGAGANYQLSQPVTSVRATFDLMVNSAFIEHEVLGMGGGDVRASAFARHDACGACDASIYEIVAARYGPGTTSVSGRAVTLTLEIKNAQGSVPAGTLTVQGMITSWGALSFGAGRIASSADATLTKIVVTPSV